jgi:very-short-patch-repair endonuclease
MRLLGGVASVGQLKRLGFGGPYVRAARRNGAVVRVRRGWYALPSVNPLVVAAATVGGSLTCVSGCQFYGAWLPPDAGLHVAVPKRSRHLKHPLNGLPVVGTAPGLTIHWSGPVGLGASFAAGALPIRECLVEVLHCQPPDFAFAILESLLANRALGMADVEWLSTEVPSRRLLLRRARSDAGSGTESLFRYRMSRLGIEMQSQVEVDGVGRVDFVIGDRLIVEIDSRQHHGERAQRIRDLDRDAAAHALGYLPLRFDYIQVTSDWDAVASTVLAITNRGDHLSQSRNWR